jgi:riboflavin kinase/FMN adenylyltransferase
VSSTRVREALSRGAVDDAARLLGRPHRVAGTVVGGARRGRQLGFPTANLLPPPVALPAEGVYAGRALLEAGPCPAVVNVGRRPTFGHGALRLEAHLLDWEGDLYGRSLSVEFVARLRGEQRFPGAEALRAQIEQDVASARRLLGPAGSGAIVGSAGP